MRWLLFSLSQSVGALAWALIYSTVGFAFWATFGEIALTGDSGALIWALVVIVMAAMFIWWRRTRSRRQADPLGGCPWQTPRSDSPAPEPAAGTGDSSRVGGVHTR